MAEWSTPQQAARQAWQQGIDGLLVGAGSFSAAERSALGRFDWGRFPAVKMSRALPELALHLVRHSPFDYMMTTLQQVWARGYRRIAVVLHHSDSERDDQARLGAVLAFITEHAGEPEFRCVWRRQPVGVSIDRGCFEWVCGSGVEVVVVDHWWMAWELCEAGLRVPQETGMAAVMTEAAVWSGAPKFSGCDQRCMERYRIALDILAEQILAGHRGFAAQPLESVVEPVWLEGETLPRRGGGG
jgi:DNA-binding LacI/PurR family transcriptional regulator